MTTLSPQLDAEAALPRDAERACLVGRAWSPRRGGPCVVTVREGYVYDITSPRLPTMRELLETRDPAREAGTAPGERLAALTDVLANSDGERRDPALPCLIAPVDLQAVKASGVTFVASLLERVIEEHAGGDPGRAAAVREEIDALVGADLSTLVPGSQAALALRETLIARGAWSQYLEVGIGPDAEIFTKAQPLSAVGTGADVGVHPASRWNNPEPEVALAVNSRGNAVGATLGNDVNLRDVEGRSALLLGRAKDNNASCALGPFIRLFDDGYGLDDLRAAEVALTVEGGDDGFRLDAASPMASISRDPADLVAATIDANHQYPDGLVLMLGTPFAPVQDRDKPGLGFTHHSGDITTIAEPRLGTLSNRVRTTDTCPRWTFGAGALMRNLAARGLL
ncbi:fumarylacetoacetate hydrolase family protein [Arhodomonas aquaeolei]|uniref:fumarylacetoacetate hydrolase family protein n=1 Tax=Arhodomonas aquaeolei TaxID=2369 RepID=UPI0021684CD9|nr:fumarylacetoacetate hydrolase family protein [Arhodomonas aquaeolei]MCS4503628.1 fumarylacetoacetate hydrolase family protein [Arhodomonas aquaeolei]